jgi:hypothetical protein
MAADLSRHVFATHREVVMAPPTLVWTLLLDQIHSPENYLPGVTYSSVFNEFGTHFVDRKVKLGDKIEWREIVSADPNAMTVLYRAHAEDPAFSGFVSTTILPDPHSQDDFAGQVNGREPETCFLDHTMSLTAKPGMPQEAFAAARKVLPATLLKSFEATKHQAERLNRQHAKAANVEDAEAARILELQRRSVKG